MTVKPVYIMIVLFHLAEPPTGMHQDLAAMGTAEAENLAHARNRFSYRGQSSSKGPWVVRISGSWDCFLEIRAVEQETVDGAVRPVRHGMQRQN